MNGQATSGLDPEYPPVSWGEVRDHLIERLMMDQEWIVEHDKELEWWPTPLPMRIFALGVGTFPDSEENWIRVAGETLIAEVDEDLGRRLAGERVAAFPVGALIYGDGGIYLTTIYSFNPRNRSLLAWFHQSLLIQAMVALDLAAEWESIEGVRVPSIPHPISGERSDVDELVLIYGQDELGLEVDKGLTAKYEAIRPSIRDAIMASGYQPGFRNDEVDFFNLGFQSNEGSSALEAGAFDFGFGFMRGTALERKLGPSLTITARVLIPGAAFDHEGVTFANGSLCGLPDVSVFGYVSGPGSEAGGSSLWATVPHLTLAEWSNLDALDFRNSVLNAIWHVAAAAQRLRRDVIGIDWQPTESDG